MTVDFGRTAADYARYRTAFPPELFTRLAAYGVGRSGQRIVDLGTGTGVLARDLAAAGCTVTGVDVARELLDVGRARDAGLPVTYVEAPAEATGLPEHAWDAVCAGQCWHWFDRALVAAEVRRLLVDGGMLAICYRDYVLADSNVCTASEKLVLRHNPGWTMAGANTIDAGRWAAELESAGFTDVETFGFDQDVPFTHEAWRGRMRTSNGVGASLSEARIAAFDDDLASLLRDRFPDEPILVPHRIWALVARTS